MRRAEQIKKLITTQKPRLSSERAEILTDYYQRSESEPPLLRRAHALDAILTKKSIYLLEGELIAGNQSVRPRAAEIFPEFSVRWVLEELDDFANRDSDAFQIDERTKDSLRRILPWWEGRTTQDKALERLSHESLAGHREMVYILTSLGSGVGHLSVDYEKCLRLGIRAILEQAENLEKSSGYGTPEQEHHKDFYRAVRIVCEAIIKFARRFAVLAEELAVLEENPRRKNELNELSRICRKVPEFPAESFHEAVQAFWFVHVVLQIESNGHSISPGRFDQYMYPYYSNDVKTGRITPAFATELLENLWIKFNEIIKVRDKVGSKAFGGYPMFQNLLVGGVDKEGGDCTNELSYLCMRITRELKLPQPSFSVRWHQGTPREFMREAVEIVKAGIGMPAFFNDEVIIPILRSLGYSLVEARNYAEVGCVEPQAPGTTEGYYPSGFLNLAKILEITLNNGINPLTRRRIGLETGTAFACFEDFYAAYEAQIGYFCRLMAEAINIIDDVHGRYVPVPFCSCFVADCLKQGRDIREGGARYNFSSPNAVGLANAADSLEVIRGAVFRDKLISYDELREVVLNDFKGQEPLRLRFLKTYPKYGNDVDEVDSFARALADFLSKTFFSIPNSRGGKFTVGLQSISAHALFVNTVGATPDGRKMAMLLADGGCSPAQGRDRHGPTAVMRSVAKIDHFAIPNGTLLNIKLHPTLVDSEAGTENLIALVESYFMMMGQHVQFNVVDAETLRRAQREPEQFRDLVVRVAGFSVYFVMIDGILQEDIIRRTEQAVL